MRFNENFSTVHLPTSLLPGFEGESAAGGDGGDSGSSNSVTQEAVTKIVNDTVNSAISNLRKKDLPAMFNTHLGPLTAQLTELSSLFKAGNGGAPGSDQVNLGNGSGNGSAANGASNQNIPPEVNATLRQLQGTLKQQGETIASLTKAKESAERQAKDTSRDAFIRESLTNFTFATPSAAQTAFTLIKGHVQEAGDDGGYIAGDNLPVVDFAREFLSREHSYLLKATEARGSGASGGSNSGGGKAFDIGSIKPGMSAEARARAVEQINNAYAEAQRR